MSDGPSHNGGRQVAGHSGAFRIAAAILKGVKTYQVPESHFAGDSCVAKDLRTMGGRQSSRHTPWPSAHAAVVFESVEIYHTRCNHTSQEISVADLRTMGGRHYKMPK